METRRLREPLAPEEVRARLQAATNRGLWPLVLFVLVSLWARRGFAGLPAAPVDWDAWLGRPPPASWINGLFVVYVFSALVRGLAHLADGDGPFHGFRHVGYLTAFYGFYHVSGALPDSYWAVLVGGFAVLVLEAYRNRLSCLRRLR